MTKFSTIIRTSAVGAATVLALGLLMLAVGTSPAQATFPGANGKIAFLHGPVGRQGDISTMNPNGSGRTNLSRGIEEHAGAIPLW
ncbi:MAG TPA: hypothetical protein VGV91_00940, partial [Rubrobacter sp.]|nr:hypothetical protein [Rubrobacter sp.]